MILITSAAYTSPGLVSEFGKIPPCMLPVQNKRLYEHQIALFSEKEEIYLSLPESYSLTAYDKQCLNDLSVTVLTVPDNFSLGQSLVYCLNVIADYTQPLTVLHGDTMFYSLPNDIDCCLVGHAEDNYSWATGANDSEFVYAGYFSFSDQSLLVRKITANNYDFIQGVKAYNQKKYLKEIFTPEWLDFNLVNSYYRSISKFTTQRVFNSLKVTRYSVTKYSKDAYKILGEANWFQSLPVEMKHYAPTVWNSGNDQDRGFYEIEYYYLSSLSNLYVFGENPFFVWKEIIDACKDFIDQEARIKPLNLRELALQNNALFGTKTQKRLAQYCEDNSLDMDQEWCFNGMKLPSLREIGYETDSMISKADERFVNMMHGDFCFSNILYDFKAKSIKVIDPRGVDLNGNYSIYGDLRYDVAKLAHSVIGLYDFIIAGRCDYKEYEAYSVSLSFHQNDAMRQVIDYFKGLTFGGYSFEELNIYPILVHLFLSMLPLHHDRPERQKRLLANALRLYVELKK